MNLSFQHLLAANLANDHAHAASLYGFAPMNRMSNVP